MPRDFATILKDATAGGVHIPTALGNQKPKRKPLAWGNAADQFKTKPAGDELAKVYSDVADLPAVVREHFKDEPTKARQWMHVFNGELKNHGDEKRAMASAWSTAQKRDDDWSIAIKFTKIDDDERTVAGWASVTHEGGQIVTDVQGDQIEVADLVKAADDFILTSRVGGDMHDNIGIGHVVQSVVFTPEMQKAIGVDLGKVGWFIKMRVSDDKVWARVKSGELGAFSIGGAAVPVAI